MKKCPAVLSLGKRVILDGYDFVWKHGQRPKLTDPNGKTTVCKVRGLCPYIDEVGSCFALPAAKAAPRAHEPLPAPEEEGEAHPLPKQMAVLTLQPKRLRSLTLMPRTQKIPETLSLRHSQ